MENWKALGALFSGIAALLTALVTLHSSNIIPHQLTIPGVSWLLKVSSIKQSSNSNSVAPVVSEESSDSKKAIIYDQDGWTNLRQLPTTTSITLQKLYNNEEVEVGARSGNWYQVKTKSNQIGFVYKTNILFN